MNRDVQEPTGRQRLDGKTVVVTGGANGLGYFSSEQLAALGATVVIAGRNRDRARAAIAAISGRVPGARVEYVHLDLADLASISATAAELGKAHRIDAVLANAAAVGMPNHIKPKAERGSRALTTADGYELYWGTNHLGHFALLAGLMPRLVDSGARIVHVGSLSHGMVRAPADTFPDPRVPASDLHKYSQPKLAVMSFGFELARRFAAAGVQASSVVAHPGTAVDSLADLPDGVASNQPVKGTALEPLLSVFTHGKDAGARSLLAAIDPGTSSNGEYWGPGGFLHCRGAPAQQRPRGNALDRAAAASLIRLSEERTGLRLPV